MKHILRLLAAAFVALSTPAHPAGQATAESGSQPLASETPAASSPAEPKPEVTPEEKTEKEARKACKAKICDIIASRDPNGEDVACDIVKTWREADIVKMLGGKIGWPWGKAVCQSRLDLERRQLALAMSEASHEIVMPLQKLTCTLAQKTDGEPYTVEVTLAPTVKFVDGKATEAKINWGEATAPLLIYPLIYAGTGLDNQTNVLGPEVVRMVNEFTTKKCAQLKVEADSGEKTASP
jgi:hypothetical protein